MEQGIILEEQGIFFDVTGNFQGEQGNSFGGRRETSVLSSWMEF
jgi:hypothetical protein